MLRFARILIVDDSRTARKIVRAMLEAHDFRNIDEANSGFEAVGLLQHINYGLVVSDWYMEPMNGMDLLAAVRSTPRTARLPFIMITAASQKKLASIARDDGLTHYLAKPFTAEMFMERVKTVGRQLVRMTEA